jgi:hypothetical protein
MEVKWDEMFGVKEVAMEEVKVRSRRKRWRKVEFKENDKEGASQRK